MLIEIFCQKLTVSNVILAFFDILKPNIFFVDQLWWPTYSANPFQNLWIRSWIMKSHFKLYKTYAFPKVHLHRCQRSCKIEYLDSGLVYSKKDIQYIILFVHCFQEHRGLLLILDMKVGITFMRNKNYTLVANIKMMLQREPLE